MYEILAIADNYRNWGASMRYAGELAALLDSALTGIFVCEPIVPYSPSPLPVLPAEIYTIAADMAREAQAAGPQFKQFLAQLGVSRSHWLVAQGSFAGAVSQAANWQDFLVVGSGGTSAWGSPTALGQLLLSTDSPCFVVPESFAGKAAIDVVAIAWNGSSEAVRAVHAAMPLIQRAKRVLVLYGDSKESFSSVAWRPPFTLESYLERHGVPFAKEAFRVADDAAGAKLLEAAQKNAADLLIMGAYGRSRFSEWVLGGATRHVLQHGSLPVFMRH